MLVLALCILATASPLLFGGNMSRLAHVRFRGLWILLAALVAQILIIEVFPSANETLLEAIHIATYVAAGLFVAVNWRVPGLLVIAAGGAMNGITIALNGGQLPASKEALKMAGLEVAKGDFINSAYLPDPVLPLLGDIFVWPQPFPLANVFSFGDVLIVFGVFYGANKIAGSRLVKKAWQVPGGPDLATVDESVGEQASAVDSPSEGATDDLPRRPRHAVQSRPAVGTP